MTASRVRPVSRKPFTAEIQQRRDLRVSNEQILHEIKSLEGRLEKLAVGNVELEGATPGTLLDQVERTKKEIATLITQNTKDDRLATAARELQAVVRATESATFTIIDIAERVDELLHDLKSHTGDSTIVATADEIAETTTDLHEACNFQDITGQRIKKVVNTLQFVEERLVAMIEIWGADTLAVTEHSAKGRDGEEKLLQGPQMEEDAIAQEDIDKLFE
jgi:chemotaxis protein CheZ